MYVHSYPRSGTHYLRALLEENFGPAGWWRGDPHQLPVGLEEGEHFYIVRNFDDAAASFLARDRNATELERFRNSSWKELFESGALLDSSRRREWIPSEYRHLTPYEYWQLHTDSWRNTDGVFVVAYEDLVGRFQETMLKIAKWLGSDRSTFTNVTKKADPAPAREGGFRAQ